MRPHGKSKKSDFDFEKKYSLLAKKKPKNRLQPFFPMSEGYLKQSTGQK